MIISKKDQFLGREFRPTAVWLVWFQKECIMKTISIRMSNVLAGMVGVATLFLMVPLSMSASPGMGWDATYYTGEGEPITAENSSYQSSAPGQGSGFDLFNAGEGVKVGDFASAYIGTAMGSEARGGGWDIFRSGEGDPLP